MRSRQKHIANVAFIVVTVPLLAMCATFLMLNVIMPQYRAPVATVAYRELSVPVSAIQTAIPSSPISSPRDLKINKINVSATIQPVGLTAEGNMDIDENPKQAAWYNLGPKPGQEGSAVIAGHYGWKKGVPSVFNDLHTLTTGDEISTLDENGQEMTFVVTHLVTYAPDQDATDVFKSDDGKAHLNLVTCQGSWNNTRSTYSERLVVFTDFVK